MTTSPRVVFQYPGVEPLLNVPVHAAVGYAMLDEWHHPVLVDGVEEPVDICVEHPAYLTLFDSNRHGVQRLMWAAAGTETIGEP